MPANSVFTIGHSTRPLAELVSLLKENGVDCLVDVRAHPGSRTNPQYNKDSLVAALPAEGIEYRHVRALGGRRGQAEAPGPSPNTLWRNLSFRRYADYALGEEFRAALDELIALAGNKRCALMCSEAVWWRCHRRIIADYLLAAGLEVRHIMGAGKTPPASLTPGARPQDGGRVLYPPEAAADL